MASKQARIIIAILAFVFIGIPAIGWIASSNDSDNHKTPQTEITTPAPATPATPERVESQAPAQPVAAPPPVQKPAEKQHYYVMEEDGEYGYEPALSENDRKDGTQAKALLMFRFLGNKDGVVSVQLKDGSASQTVSCKAPCDFIKVRTTFAGEVIKTETIKSTGQAIIDAVLQDALNGALEKYKAPNRS